jgi:osmotically-inducible protein OsmY
LCFAGIVTGTLFGCAEYGAYRKCGSGGCPGDAQLTAEVRQLLNQHPESRPPNQVYVQTLDRVVYLSGQVATELQRDTAESAAREARDARRVVDIIALTYAGR